MKKKHTPKSLTILFCLILTIAACNVSDVQKSSSQTDEKEKELTRMEAQVDAPLQDLKQKDVNATELAKKTGEDEISSTVSIPQAEGDVKESAPAESNPATQVENEDMVKHEISITSPATFDWETTSRSACYATPLGATGTSLSWKSADVAATPYMLKDKPDASHTIGEFKEPVVTTVSGAAPSSASKVNSALAGQLTAGEINDFQKWNMWEDIASGELEAYRKIWGINPTGRYSVLVQTEDAKPIIDCEIELVAKGGKIIWKTKTDNTGKGELWSEYNLQNEEHKVDFIQAHFDGKSYKIERPKHFDKGINTFVIRTGCDIPDITDVLFTVDATGSMGDEIEYLQAELVDVVNKVKGKHDEVDLRLGSVFYRDHGDTYLTVHSPFSSDVNVTNDFIGQQYADGGGDGPEAVEEALVTSIDEMNWSVRARARLMFIILDAPPHGENEITTKMNTYVKLAAEKGIRIIPLVASGGGYDIDKSLEYLMRCCALATNGTYAFLTDHSGIGGAHTAPSTDDYKVETLNTLLLRIIDQFLYVPDCNVEQFVLEQNPEDTTRFTTEFPLLVTDSLSSDSSSQPIVLPGIFTLTCYPNPATDYIWVQTSEQVKELFLADNSGKIIERMTPSGTLFQIDLTNYPTGVYLLKAWINEKWASTRIVVARI